MTTDDPMTVAVPSLHVQPPSTNQQDVYYLAATSSSLQGAHERLGVMIGPRQTGLRPLREGRPWGGDNDAYHDKFTPEAFELHLMRLRPFVSTCLFGALPDFPHDPDSTLAVWRAVAPEFAARNAFPMAFVAQTGTVPDDIPQDANFLFLAGDDAWRESPKGRDLIQHAHESLGIPIHVGRVNSLKRFMHYAAIPGVRSMDGTYLSYRGLRGVGEIGEWLRTFEASRVPPLFGRTP